MAGPIPSLPLNVTAMGESDIMSFTNNDGINIDWIVQDATSLGFAGAFAYLFQIENTSGFLGSISTVVDVMTISLPHSNGLGILAAGDIAGDNLDLATAIHAAHDPSVDPILTGEEEGFTFQDTGLLGGVANVSDDNVTWHLATSLLQGNQSQTLYFVHRQPPQYGNASAQNHVPPSPWASTSPGSDPVPVPVPLPAAIWAALPLFGGMGVAKKIAKFTKA